MPKHRIEICGQIIPDGHKFYYDWLGATATCPRDVKNVLLKAAAGDEIEVYVNSPGGVVEMGSEIYTMLRETGRQCDMKIYITGVACSAASMIAMAGYCEMAPTALMMVHCTSSSARGNHSEMERVARILNTADLAICTAYMAKVGMSQEDALQMMENETWLTAEQAKEKGLIDAVMFEEKEQEPTLVAGAAWLPTEDMLEAVRKAMAAGQESEETDKTPERNAARCRYKALELRRKRSIEC